MNIKYVLTAVNENNLYIDFIPIFIKAWESLYEIEVKIILIMNEIPSKFLHVKDNIILFKPINNLSTVFQSQVIRLLYPSLLNTNDGILITDIDMIPLNKTFFTNCLKTIDETNFVNIAHSTNCGLEQYQMCYNIANSIIWNEIFNINTEDDIIIRMMEIHNRIILENKIYWVSDQYSLYYYLNKWNKHDINFKFLDVNFTNTKLLCRNFKKYILDFSSELQNKIKHGFYTDYHMLRPYIEYKEINDKILNIII